MKPVIYPHSNYPTVYLAGPITGLSFKGATDWREYASDFLYVHGFRGVSPMRAKDYLADETNLAAMGYAEKSGLAMPLSTPQGILTRDRFDCTHADLVLFNLVGAEKVSIGTMMEVAWADLARVPAVLAMEPGNVHEHGMVTAACGFRTHGLEEALALVVAILKGSAVHR